MDDAVIDFAKERDKRALESLKREMKNFKMECPDLDLFNKKIDPTAYVMGDAEKACLSILLFDRPEDPDAFPTMIGVLRVNLEQWREIVGLGNRILKAHADAFKSREARQPGA